MIIEFRTYRLRPGTQAEFVRAMREESLPLLAAAGVRVLAAGPSLVSEEGHEEAYLIRAFDSIAAREAQEAAFYGSDAWRNGPREAILAKIVDYHTIVVEAPDALVRVLADHAGQVY